MYTICLFTTQDHSILRCLRFVPTINIINDCWLPLWTPNEALLRRFCAKLELSESFFVHQHKAKNKNQDRSSNVDMKHIHRQTCSTNWSNYEKRRNISSRFSLIENLQGDSWSCDCVIVPVGEKRGCVYMLESRFEARSVPVNRSTVVYPFFTSGNENQIFLKTSSA